MRLREHLDDRRCLALRAHRNHRPLIAPFHARSIDAASRQSKACYRAALRQIAGMFAIPILARATAFGLAIVGLAALRAQFDALTGVALAVDRIWAMAGYFTILTNAALVVHLLAITKGWQISARRAGALMVAIGTVGILYHALLANQFPTEGLGWWADLGLHTVMPAGFALWWLVFAPKAVRWSDVPYWLIWPALYTALRADPGQLDRVLALQLSERRQPRLGACGAQHRRAGGGGAAAEPRRGGTGADHSLGQAGLVQQRAALTVFQLDHPQIGVAAALTGDQGIHLGLWPLGQHHPNAGIGQKIKAALIGAGLTVQQARPSPPPRQPSHRPWR